ncbi:MAG: hypothetical protein FWB77_02540 [Treponema sp.]|nr:hypothetical protein [Treponema sp.]
MKKIMFVSVLLFIVTAFVFSNDVFFPTKVGTTQLTANLNSHGRVEGYSLMKVKDVKGADNDMTIVYTIQVLDRNRKPADKTGEREYSVKITDGVVEFELKNTMDAFFAAKNMNYSISGNKLLIPSNMTAGSKINNSWMKMIIKVPVVGEVVADVAITDITCTGIEAVTVPAGTFEAYKITQTSTTVTTGWIAPKIVNKGTTWYAKGIGMVKSVNYDEKGKLESSSELHELVSSR